MKQNKVDQAALEAQRQIAIAQKALIDEILSNFVPTPKGQVADYEPTSAELANKISETITISANQIAVALTLRGYHVKLSANTFRWQISYKETNY